MRSSCFYYTISYYPILYPTTLYYTKLKYSVLYYGILMHTWFLGPAFGLKAGGWSRSHTGPQDGTRCLRRGSQLEGLQASPKATGGVLHKTKKRSVYIYIYICMYVCIYIYIYICVPIYGMHVSAYTVLEECPHARWYVCMQAGALHVRHSRTLGLRYLYFRMQNWLFVGMSACTAVHCKVL